MIKVVLFDLDGVLVDAVKWHEQAFIRAVKEVSGHEVTEIFHDGNLNGLPTRKKLAILVDRKEIKAEDADAISDLKQKKTVDIIQEADLYKNGVEDRKGKLRDTKKMAMMSVLKADGMKIGVVTNSIRRTTELMLDRTGLFRHLDYLGTNQDVDHPKPHPEGYWKAMSHFGALPSETLIVEDSDKGMAAALATGAHVWRVTGPHEVTWQNIAEVLKDASTDSDGGRG